MPSLPTGTVSFLFTDIEGSTELLQRLGDRRYAEVLAEHKQILREAFAEGRGQEIDTQGDAFLVAFSRARDAVGAAVAAQRSLSKHTWPDAASLRVRMGLHTGEPISEAAGYVGLDVHRAARICSAGHGSQILLSQTVVDLAAPDLPPGVSLRDLGAHRLKDLKDPEHLFQVLHPELVADFPPLKSLDARPNNLPLQLTSFIGRVREIGEVKQLLGAARLVTLTGSGGAGKTRLALQVAVEVLEEFPDGVWLVELAPLSDPSLVPKTVASALNVSEQPGRALTETLTAALRLKTVLVILDNCEHLVAACARLTDTLLRVCPNLRILTTSREAIGVAGEATWQVPSLSVPDPEHLPPLDRFNEYEAVQLFTDRATASAPQFTVTGRNAPAVARICYRLDGIPLAIELAAARVKVLTVDQIAGRLDDRFRLLTGGSRTVPPRQQTLRATMDWSYDLLSEKERILLRRLAVFAGGWGLGAAEAICSGNGVEASDILDLLTRLVDKSLVLADAQGGEARYRLLETVKEYGWARLSEAGEATDVRKRHRDWYLALAERTNPESEAPRQGTWPPELQGAEHGAWLNKLEVEHDNLRAALEWSRKDTGGAELGLRLVAALGPFWYSHGHWSEGRIWLERSLGENSDAPWSTVRRVLRFAALLALEQGDYARATALCEEGLAACRQTGDRTGLVWFLTNLGLVARDQGQYRRAAALCEEGLTLGRELGDKQLVNLALANLGSVARHQGDYQRATALYRESYALSREIGGVPYIANALRNLGLVAHHQGIYQQASEFFAEGLTHSQEVANRWLSRECLEGLAWVACAHGHYEHCARLLGAAEALRETFGLRRPPPDQVEHERRVASAKIALGERVFGAIWAEGRAMTLEQAVEYALATRRTSGTD